MADSASPINALRLNTQEIQKAKGQLVDINAAMQSELEIAAKATEEGTTISSKGVRTTPLAIKQDMMADLQAQSANQARANSVDYEALSIGLLDTVVKEGKKADAKMAEIEEINNGSFIDQVTGLFTIPFKQAEINTAHARQGNAADTLNKVNTLMQSSAKTTAEIQTRVTDATIASMSSAIEADTRAEAAKLRAHSHATNAQAVLQVTNLSGDQLKNKIQEYNIVKAEEQTAFMNEQRLAMRRQHDKDVKEERLAGQLFDLVNLGLTANGKEPMPESQRELMQSQLNRTGPMGDSLRELAFQGQTIMTSGGKVVQGSTPAEALEFRAKINYEPTTESERNTLDIISRFPELQEYKDAKTTAAKVGVINSYVQTKLKQDQENVSGSPDSLAKPATWATLATSEAIRNNRLWKEVISPSITDNISTNYAEPKEMYTRLVGAVTSGKATINEAADLYHMYAGFSVEMNNANSGLEKLTGLRQSKFTARLPQPASGVAGFLGKAGELQVNFWTKPVTAVLEATTGIDATQRLGGGYNSKASAAVNGLDKVAVTNAMAKSIAGQLRKTPK